MEVVWHHDSHQVASAFRHGHILCPDRDVRQGRPACGLSAAGREGTGEEEHVLREETCEAEREGMRADGRAEACRRQLGRWHLAA